MTAAHFIYIPCVVIAGVVVGWILGGRAARDFYATELRKRDEKAKRALAKQAQAEADLAATVPGFGGKSDSR